MKKSFLAFLILGCSCFIPLGTIGIVSLAENSNRTIIDENTFEDTYEFNSIVNFPTIEESYLKTNKGINKVNYAEVCFPDGSKKSPNKYTLDMAGIYQVNYFDDAGYSISKDFVVNKNRYESVNGVSAQYYDKLPLSGTSGIRVNLVSDGIFKFNRTINIHSFARNVVDVCNIYPLFRQGPNDIPAATFCTIKLVDAYDSSKFLEIYNWCDKSNLPFYAGAGSSKQNFTGMEINKNRPDKINCYFEGIGYNKHVTTRYQTVDAYGVWGNSRCNPDLKTNKGISFSWDLNSNKIYYAGNQNTFITDLDAPEIVESNPLIIDEYFTTGEVYAQFQCFAFNSASMDLEIVSVLGLSGEELKDAIIFDYDYPEIIVPGLDNDTSSITVFKGEKFYIPNNVYAQDFNYYGDIKYNVYYNYGQADQSSVFVNEYFIPEELGTYSLVYTARDGYKNTATRIISLNCVNSKPFTYQEKKVSNLIGSSINYLPKLDVTSKNGNFIVKVTAKDPKGEISNLVFDEEQNGYKIIPNYIGEYEINYEIKDNFYTQNFNYKVNSIDNNKIYYSEKPSLYPYYIKGAYYSLDEFYGIKATQSGPIEVKADSYISVDNGNFTKINNINKFLIEGNNSVRFKFIANDNEYISDVLEIVDLGYKKTSGEKQYYKYFQGNYYQANEETSDISYSFLNNGSMSLINFISLSNFILNFQLVETNTFNSLSLNLTNYKNDDDNIQILFERMGGTSIRITITRNYNGESMSSSGFCNSSNSKNSFSLKYLNSKLSVDSYVSLDILEPFELTILSFECFGSCDIKISQVNNQPLYKASKMTEKGPQGYFESSTGAFESGSVYTVSKLIGSCVLAPVLKEDMTVSVYDVNNNIMLDINNLPLDNVDANKEYFATLTECGQYSIDYKIIVDCSTFTDVTRMQNLDTIGCIANVNDAIKPTITFSSHEVGHVKKDSIIKVRSYTVNDNKTSLDNLKVYIMFVDDHYNVIETGYNKETCAMNRVGKFKVLGYVIDEYGNIGMDSYDIVVEA